MGHTGRVNKYRDVSTRDILERFTSFKEARYKSQKDYYEMFTPIERDAAFDCVLLRCLELEDAYEELRGVLEKMNVEFYDTECS